MKARLLEELACRAGGTVLALVKLARRNLDRHTTEGDTILANETDAPVAYGDDTRPSPVPDDLAPSVRAVRELDVEKVDGEDSALPHALVRSHLLEERGVGSERLENLGHATVRLCVSHVDPQSVRPSRTSRPSSRYDSPVPHCKPQARGQASRQTTSGRR